jgi:hypothetical protein
MFQLLSLVFRKKSIATVLAAFMVLALLPVGVLAASVSTGVAGLSAESTSAGTWGYSSGTISGSVAASASSNCGSTTYSAQESTLTFTNSSGARAQLSFSYTSAANGGSVQIAGTDAGASGTYTTTLEANGTLAVKLTSNSSNDTATTISITNISLTQEKNVNITFNAPASGGSYTYAIGSGSAVEASGQTETFLTTETVTLTASPASGYKLLEWVATANGSERAIGSSSPLVISFSEDATITPRFVDSTTPIFLNGGKTFTDLNAAVSNAVGESDKKVVLIGNGTLPAGDYTIPNGVTLLIPYDDGYTLVTDTPNVIYGSHTTPSAFRLLTMANGANITVANGGAISCAGQLCSTGQLGGWNGCPTGPDGRIKMNNNSTINVQSGGKLYVWGYIYGNGLVEVQSGATVYEAFQLKDWRGGTATSNCYSYTFIISQYYIQNIEVAMKMHAGCTEKLYSSANASSSAYPMGATFIGSGGMFNISSGYLIKDYIESTDRLQIDCYGNVSVTTMTLTGLPLIGSLSTTDYELPITNNVTLNLHSGNVNTEQNIKLLPGVEINVDEGASMQVNSGKKIYVYDLDNWGNYTGSAQLYVIGYSVANGTTAKRNASSLRDAMINVNGSLNIVGSLYTSLGGANITSSEAKGSITFTTSTSSNSTIYEMENNSTKTSVTFNPARLKNADGYDPAYTTTAGSAAGTTFYYNVDHWGTEVPSQTYTVTWNNYNGDVLEIDENVSSGSAPEYNGTTPSRPEDDTYTYSFEGWKINGEGDLYTAADLADYQITEDTVFVAYFSTTTKVYTISYYVNNTLVYQETLPVGAEITAYNYTPGTGMTFSGWDPAVPTVMPAHNVEVYGTTAVATYTITWKNDDGSVIDTTTVAYGEMPTHADPSKAADAQYTYTFAGWSPELTAVTGNAEYTATYNATVNTYTITWKNDDGSVIDTTTVAYGEMPTHADPSKAADAQYTYTFAGWSPELTAVTGNAEYTATYNATVNTYTVTFKDWDGTVLKTETVNYGGAATAPADPTRVGYTFTGWDVAFDNVTSDLVVTAQYTINTYTVTFVDWDGTVLKTQTVAYGGAATAPANPTRVGYTFTGWDVAFNYITGNLTVTAQYEEDVPPVTVLPGDVDCNGVVNMADLALAASYVQNSGTVTEQGILNGDMNGDGAITAADLAALYQLILS